MKILDATVIETNRISDKAQILVRRQASLSGRPMRVERTVLDKTKYRIVLDPTPRYPITFEAWQVQETPKAGPIPLPTASIYTFPNGERLMINNQNGEVATPEEYQDFDRDYAPVPPRRMRQ